MKTPTFHIQTHCNNGETYYTLHLDAPDTPAWSETSRWSGLVTTGTRRALWLDEPAGCTTDDLGSECALLFRDIASACNFAQVVIAAITERTSQNHEQT